MMEKISIQEIATVLIEKNGLKRKEADQFVLTMFDLIKESLTTDRVVKVKGLGTFKVVDIEARESVNVNTGERVLIEGHDKITFTPDNSMKELVNKPFSQFETVVLNDGVTFDDMSEAEGDSDIQEGNDLEPLVESESVMEPESVAVTVKVTDSVTVPEAIVEANQKTDTESVSELEPEPAVESEVESIEESVQTHQLTSTFLEPQEKAINTEEPTEKADVEESADDTVEEEPVAETINEPFYEPEEEPEEYMSKKMTYISLVIAILICALSFVGGYYYGNSVGNKTTTDVEMIDSDAIAEVSESKVNDTMKNDSSKSAVAETEAKSEVEPLSENNAKEKSEVLPEVKDEPKDVPQPKADPQVTPQRKPAAEPKAESKPVVKETISSDKYDQMDSRVRTGAYRIIGNDYQTKVKAGETLAKIARRTLGPDMECYIEVFNGIKSSVELKEGQSINIPKLELKKKKKVNN